MLIGATQTSGATDKLGLAGPGTVLSSGSVAVSVFQYLIHESFGFLFRTRD